MGGRVLLQMAAAHPDRVAGAVFVAPTVRLGEVLPQRLVQTFEDDLGTDEGWARYNAEYWRRDFAGFAEFFFGEIFVEPHSSKQIEDSIGWALETDPDTLIATVRAPHLDDSPGADQPGAAHLTAQVMCPCLVVHGDADRIVSCTTGLALAELLGCPVEIFVGGGHCVHARHPVRFNLLLRTFAESVGARA